MVTVLKIIFGLNQILYQIGVFELQVGQGYEIIILDTIFGCSDTLLIDTIQANFEISVSETINDVLLR